MIKKIFKYLFIMVLVAVLAGGCFVGYLIVKAPSLNKDDATPDGYLTVILDQNGKEILSLHDSESNRVYVELPLIPEDLQHAFVAIEDSRFYSHSGVDAKGIARAMFVAIKSGFKFTQGGSTITQQLVKNNVLTTWTSEDGMYDKVCRKIQEIYLSVSLEKKHDKDWILENYLNTINLGGGTRGVQTASQYYFGKNPSELTLAQCALIAGITKNPNGYNPFKNLDKSLERQHLVLKDMLEQGYITEEAYNEAMAEDIASELDTNHLNYASSQVFSYFEDALLETIVEDLCAQYDMDSNEAWNMLYSGGLTIQSTQDSDLQSICEKKVQDSSLYDSDEEVSVVMTDVSTGAVLAMVGGREEKTASLIYNRATDSERQPGSTIKIVGEYAAALDNNLVSLGTVYEDAAMTYSNGDSFKNAYSEYKGKITLRDAIAYSSNTVAVMAYREVGFDTVKEYLDAFGLYTLRKEKDNEALAIGGTSGGVTNLEMTAAYNAIAAGGSYVAPYYYTTVTDHDGNVILQNDADAARRQVISEETADLLTSAMVSVMSDGTGTSADFRGMDLAGKSGTTNGNKDLWFMGYSPYYTCGVWGGFDDNSEQSSSSYVKTLWRNIMQEAVSVKGYSYYDKTFTKSSDLESATICTKCGKLAITGLCDNTAQGDMTRTEYFKSGTRPATSCSCHQEVIICSESGMRASNYCPEESQTKMAYLISASKDTADEDYCIDSVPATTCSVHNTSWWNQMQESLQEKVDDAENKLDEWGNQLTDKWNQWFGNSSNSEGQGDSGNQSNSGNNDNSDGQGNSGDAEDSNNWWNFGNQGNSGNHEDSEGHEDSGNHENSDGSGDSHNNGFYGWTWGW